MACGQWQWSRYSADEVGERGGPCPARMDTVTLFRKAGKKYRLVDNIGARLGSEVTFGSHKIKSSSYKINCIGKIWINMKETSKLIARNVSGKTQELFAQLIQHDGG